ncbi:MAG: hypothetical protein ACXVNM_01895 [Bacteroidia bacterium]
MRAKTLVQLLSLSTSLYMISKDEELIKKVSEIAQKGKEKLNNMYEDFSGNSEEELTDKILRTARQAKEELDKKIEETVTKVYEKMHIAHANDLKELEQQLALVKRELALAEARIVNLENGKL